MSFDKIIDRRNTGASKWEVKENELPMWVADMDFEVAPAIQKAILDRAKHPIYGYTEPYPSWADAYINFYKDVHNFEIKREWLLFSTGVVPTISSSVRKLTEIGDYVVVTPPVYNIFYNSIVNNSRIPYEVPLLENNDSYFIDFVGLEKAFSNPKTKLFILCNPANPISKIWSKEDLSKIGELAKKYNVIVLSDEIHGEITRPGKRYTPFLSVNKTNKEVGFTAISVTKSFNVAGIQTSAIVIPNEKIRALVNRQINTDEVAEGNVFSYIVAEAALNDSRDWLKEMREYVFANRDYAEAYISSNIPSMKFAKGDATYLMWLDIRNIATSSKELATFIRNKTGLYISSGDVYGQTGNGFLRMNLACPRNILEDGLNRLKKGIEFYLKSQQFVTQ